MNNNTTLKELIIVFLGFKDRNEEKAKDTNLGYKNGGREWFRVTEPWNTEQNKWDYYG